MPRRIVRHVLTDLAVLHAWHLTIHGARLWAARRSMRVGPVDPLLVARIFAEWSD